MSLDDELRSAFEHEALTRSAPPPDPGGLIRGGRVRRRRRTLQRAGAGFAATVLIGAGGYALVPGPPRDPAVTAGPSGAPTSSPPSYEERPGLAPGTHRVLVGTGAGGGRIEADFTVEGDNWSSGDFPLVGGSLESAHAGVGVYQPRTLAAGNGCREDPVNSDLGRTPRRLAEQLAELPRSTVIEAPTPTEAFGRPGLHLRLRIAGECSSFYRVAGTAVGERGITYTPLDAPVDVLIDFWVIDVAGALVVIDQWHEIGASEDLVGQAVRARKSIRFFVGD